MAVQVWIGEKPEHPNERRAIMALANGLDRMEGLYLILANFSVGGRSIDLVIIKQDAVFIIELKHCDGKVFGDVNGPWFVESINGDRKRLNPGRKNPYNQVISYFYSLTNFLNDHRRDFLSSHKAETIDFRTCKRVVVIAPTIQEGSHIELDWKVELRGLDELPAFLVTERSSEIDLTENEMLAIPELLNCTRWKEVNDIINGVLPAWESVLPPEEAVQQLTTTAAAPEATPAAAQPAPQASEQTAEPPTFVARAQKLWSTLSGRAAVTMSIVATVLLVMLLLRPVRVVDLPDGPTPPLIISTSQAAGGVMGGGVGFEPQTCVWRGYQSVRKAWDPSSDSWVTLGLSGPGDPSPDIVLTLEQVDFCGSEIRLMWNVRNNSNQTIELPLTSDTISIRDPLNTNYYIDSGLSDPSVLRLEPNSQKRAQVVVQQPVNQNAMSLKVTLKNSSVGEATWLVGLDDGR
jgi:Nuclease-related domain.